MLFPKREIKEKIKWGRRKSTLTGKAETEEVLKNLGEDADEKR